MVSSFQEILHTPSASGAGTLASSPLKLKTVVYFPPPHKWSIIVCSERPFRKNRITHEPVHRFASQINLLVLKWHKCPPEVICEHTLLHIFHLDITCIVLLLRCTTDVSLKFLTIYQHFCFVPLVSLESSVSVLYFLLLKDFLLVCVSWTELGFTDAVLNFSSIILCRRCYICLV